jgi:hypothetical protein
MRDYVPVPKMLQIRNVPDDLHRELVRRAKLRGQTLTDYLHSVLEREAGRPLPDEVWARIDAREPVDIGGPVADVIREVRREEFGDW